MGFRKWPWNPIEIDLNEGNWNRASVSGNGVIEVGVKLHLENRTYAMRPLENNLFVLGLGPFAKSPFYGVNRMTVTFRSPMTYGLHVSTCGGVGFQFSYSGTSLVILKGKSKPSVVVIEGDRDGVKDVKIDPVDPSSVYNYGGYEGVFALSKYLYDKYGEGRGIVVGPFAFKSPTASLVSVFLPHGELSPWSVDFFGRGGPGSALAQAHGVIAIYAKGDFEPPEIDPSLPDRLAKKVFGREYVKVVLDATKKYRYDPEIGSGGTFGVNYVYYRDLIPMFAYNSMYYSDQVRVMLSNWALRYFWKPFQDETIRGRIWGSCGEPCPAVCKKVWRGTKIDYEPANALGTLIGIFNLELTRELIEIVDANGMDAIETGHTIAWLFDLVRNGMLKRDELGLDDEPRLDPLNFDPIEDSERNFQLAKKLLDFLLHGGNGIVDLVATSGIRRAAKELDNVFEDRVSKKGMRFEDFAVYVAFGEEGYMTPNLYWAPGMVAPLYVLGRYWTNYKPTFMEPEEFAESSLERALKELIIDNAGMCRFHRKWGERLLTEMYKEVLNTEISLEYSKEVYRWVARYNKLANAEPVPWESKKTMDVVATMARHVMNEEWVRKFARGEGIEWWYRFKRKIDEMLS